MRGFYLFVTNFFCQSNKKSFDSTNIAEAKRVFVLNHFTNELRTPAQVGDLASALLELAVLDVAGPLHVAGADVVDRHAFAVLVARAAGLDPGGLRRATSGPDRPRAIALDSTRAQGILRTRLRGVREVLGGDVRA